MDESAFTHILRRLWQSSPSVQAVAFIDDEGEAIDYCASIEPFEAKVIGAQMVVTARAVLEANRRAGFGEMNELIIGGDKRGIIVRRMTDELGLVVATTSTDDEHTVAVAIERCVDALRREAHLELPDWEPRPKPLEVYVREATGWDYAPALFSENGGQWKEVAAVLGRWEDDDEDDLLCFRVRTRDGAEVTLAHDTKFDRWTLLSDAW
jgi:predicted regulator of Ras-like GTPase activity (Roadblock/LC7/MglB family)